MLMHALAASCEELRARTGNPPLSSDYWAYINLGSYIRGGGLIFGWAYIRVGLYLE